MSVSDWSGAQFPGACHCCLIKVGLFHRQSEVCEGASERPDERTDSSGEKLLPFFFFFFLQLCSGSPPQSSSTPLHLSLSLFGCARTPCRHLVSHYSQNSFWLRVSGMVPFLPPVFFLAPFYACHI